MFFADSLCNLCVLCVSVVCFCLEFVNHRDTENTEVAQRRGPALLFYGYRLLIVNRRTQENKDARRKHQYDQAHVYGRVLYYDSGDPRLFNDTYLLNFANKWNYLLLACVIILPLLMFYPMAA